MSDANTGSLFPHEDHERASAIIARCNERRWTLATAESCTGGLVAGLLTEIPGSSAVLDRGFVTYSNQAKSDLVGVDPQLIASHGAVSSEVAAAMADGARSAAKVSVAVSITGIAGPGGGSAAKPVGLVHFGLAVEKKATRTVACRFGDRGRPGIRLAAVRQALTLIEEALEGVPDQAAP